MSKLTTQAIKVETRIKPVAFADPCAAHQALCRHFAEDDVFLLESLAGPEQDRKASLIGVKPLFTLALWRNQVTLQGVPELLATMRRAIQESGKFTFQGDKILLTEKNLLWDLLRLIQAQFISDPALPGDTFSFGFFGYLGYDTVWYMEDLPYRIAPRDDMPDLHLSVYQCFIKFDLEHQRAQIIAHSAPGFWEDQSSTTLESILSQALAPFANPAPIPTPTTIADTISKQDYLRDVEKALHYISIGDIYQVQLGHEISIDSSVKPLDVYHRLRSRNPSPYMYYASFGDIKLIGASPELFLRIEKDLITLRPIAGTIKRGRDAEEDQRAIATLLNEEKEIAEHVMLVDLCRNDTGRVCLPNTMEVDQMMVVEKYSHVFHMVSNVIGRVAPGLDCYDVISATFPEGTLTGAPKIRAMEIIEELETRRRGAYGGALGLIGFNGYVNLALCIRTAFYTGGRYTIRASAGIVADSVPEKEWRETTAKMGANYWAITDEELAHEYAGD